jgi:hypothetical protein
MYNKFQMGMARKLMAASMFDQLGSWLVLGHSHLFLAWTVSDVGRDGDYTAPIDAGVLAAAEQAVQCH